MKKKYNFCFTLVILVLMFSCSQSRSNIEKATQMIEHAEQHKDALKQSDFDKMALKMEELQKDLETNRDNYTDEQVKEIGNLQGRYAAILVKKGMNDFEESVKDLGNQMEGFIEGITDSTNIKNK
jgi:hypothetical protein